MKPSRLFFLITYIALLTACGGAAKTPEPAAVNPSVETALLVWERSGGFAGFCDKVTVYSTGHAHVSDCKGVEIDIYLSDAERAQLNEWVKTYARIESQKVSPALANSMTTSLVLASNGTQTADEQSIETIMEFAATLQAQSVQEQIAATQKDEAEKILREFLTALHGGDFSLAAKYYGGDTSLLKTWNSDLNADLPALFENACTQNKLQCLAVHKLTYHGRDAQGGYQFLVEFNNADGTVFTLGSAETTLIRDFLFHVLKTEVGFVIMDLPPHSP